MAETSEADPLDRLQLRYQQVREVLEAEIERGRRPVGSRLPPERALAQHFGVSRVTLRRSLEEMARAGTIARSGAGWLVASPAIGEPPNVLMRYGLADIRNYDSVELPGLLGRTTHDLVRELGPGYEREVVHRDDLVLL